MQRIWILWFLSQCKIDPKSGIATVCRPHWKVYMTGKDYDKSGLENVARTCFPKTRTRIASVLVAPPGSRKRKAKP